LAWIIALVMLVYIFGAVSSIANVNYPAISAIKSMLTGPEEQGQVLGKNIQQPLPLNSFG
jgi:hypothetical protein